MERRLLNREDESDAVLNREDQNAINEFARLNIRRTDYLKQIRVLKRVAQDVEDAGVDVMTAEDDDVKFQIGDCFFDVAQDDVEAMLEEVSEANSAEITRLEEQVKDTEGRMNKLQAHLYGKFGKSINLEYRDEE